MFYVYIFMHQQEIYYIILLLYNLMQCYPLMIIVHVQRMLSIYYEGVAVRAKLNWLETLYTV